MSPAEENALVEQSLIESTVQSDANVRFNLGDAIRLAIRAAVAHERERCARVCEKLMKVEPGFVQTFGNAATGYQCAAAIRRGG